MIPYDELEGRLTPPGIPDDIGWLGGEIGSLGKKLQSILDELRGQNSPLQSILNVNPGIVVQTTVRYRGTGIVFSGGTLNDVMGVKIGSAVSFDFIASGEAFYLPLPLIIPSGQDLQVVDITTPGAVNWRCRIYATTELDAVKL